MNCNYYWQSLSWFGCSARLLTYIPVLRAAQVQDRGLVVQILLFNGGALHNFDMGQSCQYNRHHVSRVNIVCFKRHLSQLAITASNQSYVDLQLFQATSTCHYAIMTSHFIKSAVFSSSLRVYIIVEKAVGIVVEKSCI